MATLPDRALSIQYGDFLIDNSVKDRYIVVGNYQESKDKLVGQFKFFLMVKATGSAQATNDSNFATRCLLVEESFRLENKKLIVKHGDAEMINWDPALANVVQNSKGQVRTVDDKNFRRNQRVYEIQLDFDLGKADPDDPGGSAGFGGSTSEQARESETVVIEYNPGRVRTVTMTGHYTANQNGDAKTNYSSNIGAWAISVLNGIDSGAKFELQFETTDESNPIETKNRLSFRRAYQELNASQSIGIIDDPELVNVTRSLSTSFAFPGDYNGRGFEAERLVEISLELTAFVDKTTGAKLIDVFYSKLKPLAFEVAFDQPGIASVHMVRSAPIIENEISRIRGFFTFLGLTTGEGQVLTIDFEAEVFDKFGPVIRKSLDGTAYGGEARQGIPEKTRVMVEIATIIDTGTGLDTDSGGAFRSPPEISASGWITTELKEKQKTKKVGDPAGATFTLLERTIVVDQKWITPPGSGGGGSVVSGTESSLANIGVG